MVIDTNRLKEVIDNAAALQFQGYEWVTDRKPEHNDLNIWGEALITTKDHMLKIGIWNGDEWEFDAGWCGSTEVIAWAKLPEAYDERWK